MILFRDDWNEYPDAIIHTQTLNPTFIRYSALLKHMGIQNHAFPLALVDPALQNVDPYAPNLDIETMARIIIECRENPWYFFREIARVPMNTVDTILRFKANRSNMALYWLFFNHVTVMLEQIRQTGKSFSTDMLMVYLLNIGCTNTFINLLTKDDTLRSANLNRIKEMIEELPAYVNKKAKKDVANTEELVISALGNKYKGHLPNRSPKLALNVGRGLTSPIYHIDEAAFCYNIGISLPAMLAGGTAARELAKMRNEPYGTILTTTAGKKDDKDGKFVYHMRQNSAVWTESYFDCQNIEELQDRIRKNSPTGELRVICVFNHRQLGYTDQWLREAIENSQSKGDDARRDFFNEWTSGSQLSPFSTETAEKIRGSQVEPVWNYVDQDYGYVLRYYEPKGQIERVLSQVTCIIGLDTSDALGNDDIGLTLTRIDEAVPIGLGNFNETNLITFSKWLAGFMMRYPKTVLVIERRSSGAMIIDYLVDIFVTAGVDPYRRIFNKIVHEAHINRENVREVSKPMYSKDLAYYAKRKKEFGYTTSAVGSNSRYMLYSTTLNRALDHFADKIRDRVLIDQMLSLTTKNGRIDHEDGMHDDLVVSWLLCMWLIFEGKNLELYGINSREVLSKVKMQKDGVSASEAQLTNYYNNEAMRAIEAYIEEIKRCRDKALVAEYRRRIEVLKSKHDLDQSVLDNVESILKGLK